MSETASLSSTKPPSLRSHWTRLRAEFRDMGWWNVSLSKEREKKLKNSTRRSSQAKKGIEKKKKNSAPSTMLSQRLHAGPLASPALGRHSTQSPSSSDTLRRRIGQRNRPSAVNATSDDDDGGETPTTSSTSSTSTLTSTSASSSSSSRAPRVAVIGGGWAGFGAAKALVEQGYDVSLLDAAPGAGASAAGWRTKTGRR